MSNAWLNKCNTLKNLWDKQSPLCSDDGISIYHFIEKLSECLENSYPIVVDAGHPYYAVSQMFKLKRNQRYILSASQADMGCAVPASIGVAMESNAPVIAITGDGSFFANPQELSVIKYHNLPIIIFVVNNGGYMSIKKTQSKFYNGRIFGVDSKAGLWFPKIKKIADTYELNYKVITKNDDLYESLKTVLNSCDNTPWIVEIDASKDEDVVPAQALKNINGKTYQCGLDDMFPFLTEEEYTFAKNLLIS